MTARADRTVGAASGRRAPAQAGAVTAVGLLLGALLVAAGAVGLHDAWSQWSGRGRAWLPAALDRLPATGSGLLVVTAVCAAAGLGLLLPALLPRPRRAVPLQSGTAAFLRRQDVARMARAAAGEVDGVTRAAAEAGRRAVRLSVRSTAVDPSARAALAEQVGDRVTARLQALGRPFRLRVVVSEGSE